MQWIVPMKWTLKGVAVVDAETAEEAKTKAIALKDCSLDDPGASLVDWYVTGEPREDK